MDPKDRVCEVMDWIHLGQDKVGYFYHTSEPSSSKKAGSSMTSYQILTMTCMQKELGQDSECSD